jgi:hypothetical protein
MNADIERLAREAGFVVGLKNGEYVFDEMLEAFARALVEECAKIAEARAGHQGTGAYVCLTAAADAIREKFGVKP